MRLKIGSVAFLRAAGSGYGIGLDDDGHRVEFMGDWRALSELTVPLAAGEAVYADVESWQVLAVDGELRLDLGREASLERAAFVKMAAVDWGSLADAAADKGRDYGREEFR